MTNVSAVVAAEIARVTDVVFGVMGNGNAYVVDALVGHGAEYVPARHEAGAVVAADVYHRLTGRVGVATVTYGPGYTNTVTALIEARMAASALVLVTGDAPVEGARPIDADQSALASAVEVPVVTVGTRDVAADVRRAVGTARLRSGPVVLAVPFDVSTREAEPGTEATAAPGTEAAPAPDGEPGAEVPGVAVGPADADLARAAAVLRGAERPLILAGRGAWLAGAHDELGALAEDLGALTCSTLLAHRLLAGPYDLGVAGGFAHPDSLALMRRADVVLAVGARLNPFTLHLGTLLAPDAVLVQVDRRAEGFHDRADHRLLGDGREVAARLVREVALLPPAASRWRDEVGPVAPGPREIPEGVAEIARDGRLDPRVLVRRLGELLPENRVVLQDLGNFCEWVPTLTALPGAGRVTMPGSAFQSIGLGLPGVVGATRAHPGATVVLATGDGGLLMALADLESVVRTADSAVVLVLNDAGYGAEIHQYAGYGVEEEPMLIPDTDFAALGRAVGAVGLTVRSVADLRAFGDWVDAGAHGTIVLDCKVSRTVVGPVLSTVAEALERPSG